MKKYNEIIIWGDIAEIILYGRDAKKKASAIINTEDVQKIKNYRWCLSVGRNNKPAKVLAYKKGSNKILIHRLIMGVNPGREPMVDHINGDVLDNRKKNLRLCTNAENIRNQERKNSLSGYKGIRMRGNSWSARIMVNHKEKHLGSFKQKEDAIQAYNDAAMQYFGEFANMVYV